MGDRYGRLKSLAAASLSPLSVILSLLLSGLGFAGLGSVTFGLGLMAAGALCLVLAAWWPVAEGLLAPLEDRYPPLSDPAALRGVSIVVVLGGIWWPDARWPISSQLGNSSAIRLFEAVRLLRALPDARLVVTGASQRGRSTPVAWGYVQGAQELGVPAERILALDTPMDTAQEAYAVHAAVGTDQRFVLVTSASHMVRAMRHFRAVGLDPVPAPTERLTGRSRHDRLEDWLPASRNLALTELAWYQYLGLVSLRLDHWGRSGSKHPSR